MKKIIKEQNTVSENPEFFLKLALTNCFKLDSNGISQTYPWFKIDNVYSRLDVKGLVKLKDGRFAIKGFKIIDPATNKPLSTPQDIYWFADKTVLNATTGKQISWSPCKEITQTVGVTPNTSNLTPDQQKYVDDIIKNEGVTRQKPSDYETNKGKYEVIDLNKKNPTLFPQAGKEFVYKQIGAINTDKLNPEGIIQMLVTSHNAKREINPTESEMYTKVNLQTYENGKYAPHFAKEFYLYFPKEEVNIQDLLLDVKTKFDSQKVDKKQCRQAIDLLYTAYENNYGMKDSDRTAYKEYVKKCSAQNTIPMFSKNKFETLSKLNPKRTLYSLREGVESKDLKKVIRENILKINESKNASLLQEGKIINNRFNIIAEGTAPKNKKDQKKIGKELFNEMMYLNRQGYSQELISEGLTDIFSSIFPKGVSEPIMQYLKEEAAKWLAGKFGLDPNSWLSSIVISAIGDIGIGEIPRLFSDCNFATKKISKAVGEGIVRKIQVEKFGDSAFYNLLRNTLVDALEATELVTKLEEKLGTIICPLVSSLSGKMEGVADTMKQKALGTV